ncbi:MerR family transcriptional regulator [Streptomyces sp. SLBN-31]|uniref:MerR family transcriptional regulator n=1 Tax=Streptomyces sp. SLBN-31 TaxID=2768444 RepID=UPI00116D9DA8|nr:MerR family transcriptional regulator [Streptomyces sp. SLBN-31]TQJ85427.1 DNA-binding transcriptional MerR regulator [Streptomyces sp. SLBN-31]
MDDEEDGMAERWTIGEFSRITHLSIRTLRRYHEQELLVPAEVDPATGYRYYTPAQIRPALTIRRLRELDLPLADVREFLLTRSGGTDEESHAAQQIVAAHLRRLEDRLGQTQRAVEALRELLDPQAERTVSLEVLPPQRVLAVTLDIPPGTDLSWYDTAMNDLDAAVGDRPVLPPGGRYQHTLFTDGHGRATVYLPAEAPLPPEAPSTVKVLRLPQRTAAVATHRGPHDDIDLTYSALGAFASRNGLRAQDLVEEIYLVGPRDTDQPDRWRTLVAWLIDPGSGGSTT